MKKLLFPGLIVLFFILTVSCRKYRDPIADEITGKWDWLKSVSPWTGVVSDPESAGYTIAIEFSGDGVMKSYRNDTLVSTTNYTIESVAGYPGSGMLVYDTDTRVQVTVNCDSLFLNSAWLDGPVSFYVRNR